MNETLNRLIYGATIGLLALFLIYYFDKRMMALFVAVVAAVASFEFSSNLALKQINTPRLLLGANFLLPFGVLYFLGEQFYLLSILAAGIVYILAIVSARITKQEEVYHSTRFLLLHLFWISAPLCLFFLVRLAENGFSFIFYIILVNTLGDSFAYFIGKYFGKIKLNLPMSPNKTMEGFAASFVASSIGGSAFLALTGMMELSQTIVLSMLVNVSAQLGDLMESKYKRFCGVKDSSQLIPGHGGIMDRFDSYFLSVPMLYIWLYFMQGLD